MFSGCVSLDNLNLSNINTQSISTMKGMFYNCKKLLNLDLSRFYTPGLTNMSEMFYGCMAIKSLNLSSFDTQKSTTMEKMFYKCSSLESLYINNFETNNVKTISQMFYECTSLKSLNISNFDTSQVTTMSYMFYNCRSLKTLIITNFNFKNLFFDNELNNGWLFMFSTCSNLEYVNMENAIQSSSESYINMFGNIKIGTKFCTNSKGLSNIEELIKEANGIIWCKDEEITTSLSYDICLFYYYFDDENNEYICTDDAKCPENYPLLIEEKFECRKNCKDDLEYKYEFQGKCYKACPKNTKISESISYFCEILCPSEYPLKKIDNQECSNYCNFNDLINNICTPGSNIDYLDINKEDRLIKSIEEIFLEYITNNTFDTFNLENATKLSYNYKNLFMEIIGTETEKNNTNSKLYHIFLHPEYNINHYNNCYSNYIYLYYQ